MAANHARILIADDDSVSLQLLSGLFSDGWELMCVKSGEEALNSVPGFKPDIIILDTVMKGITGFEVCERLKANAEAAAIPVVFIIAKDDADAELRGLKAGGVDFITRPFAPSVVKARVSNYVDMKRSKDGLEQLSTTEPITGLFNRRYFDRMLEAEVRRASRSRDGLSLIMMSIDRFIYYNDVNGQLAGLECLKLIARTVKKSFRRSSDIVALYGGKEMAALLPSTEFGPACQLAENVRKCVEELQIAYSDAKDDGVVTLSIGVAGAKPEPGADPQTLLNQADKALYQAETAGGNRVIAAQ